MVTAFDGDGNQLSRPQSKSDKIRIFQHDKLILYLAWLNKAHGLSHYLKMAYLKYLISLWWSDLIRVLATENKF